MLFRIHFAQAFACAFFFFSAIASADYLQQINCPQNLDVKTDDDPLIVAIVDDGLLTSHEQIQPYLWNNPAEVPDNKIDDDGNGYIDDIHGWDVSDNTSFLRPPRHRHQEFYHGTHAAGIIAQMASTAFGASGPDHIRIMGVKSISNSAGEKMYLKEGYKGIEYALENGADIILCAWSFNHISNHEKELLDRVKKQGVLLVAAAGNLPEERDMFPAAHPSALAVSGMNSHGRKLYEAAYGTFVDILAPGENIMGADVNANNQYSYRSGTSFSAAIAAGAAAIIMRKFPENSPEQIKARLMNAADPVVPESELYEVRMGAGALNLRRALNDKLSLTQTNTIKRSKGFLVLDGNAASSWKIQPTGRVKGFRLHTFGNGKVSGRLKLHRKNDPTHKPREYKITGDEEQEFYRAGSSIEISFEPDQAANAKALLKFTAEPVDLSTLYCHGTTYVEEACTISDGSGTLSYSPNTDAKWLITAPPGKVVEFVFSEFDTEADVDKIYFFNGTGTHEHIMAVFSGSSVPPKLTSWTNQVLLWFVSDGKNQAQGWSTKIQFIDSPEKTE